MQLTVVSTCFYFINISLEKSETSHYFSLTGLAYDVAQ